MKKFIFKILFYVVPFVLLAIVFDVSFSFLLKQSKGFAGELEVMNDIYNKNSDCDIAVYGSSKAWVQIVPSILEDSLNKSVYNFGIDGQAFGLQYWRHLEFLKNNRKPKLIILTVDYYSLEKGINLYNKEQFLPYMFFDKQIKNFTNHFVGFSTADYFVPFYRYLGKKNVFKECLNILSRDTSPPNHRIKGFHGVNQEYKLDLNVGETSNYVANFDSSVTSLMEKFITECKENNIKLILLYPPDYIDRHISNRSEVVSTYQNISEKHGLQFIDYSENEICMKRDFFYNSNHLNLKGAELFSRQLASDLKKTDFETAGEKKLK